jgi:hypothetical protein
MTISLGRVRHVAFAIIGGGSILAGLLLAFRLFTPAQVTQLSTLELLGLLGLLVLPPLTVWAVWADRNALAKLPVPIRETARPDRIIEPKPLALDEAGDPESVVELDVEFASEIEVHSPGRRAVRHRRHDPARASA